MPVQWIGDFRAALWVLSALAAAAVCAQHGHPLVGSWSGDWLLPSGSRQRLLLALDYDDDTISGYLFIGTRRLTLARAVLDPESWSVHLEAADAGSDGQRINYLLDGRIENLGSVTDRTIAGAMSANGTSGSFELIMN